MPFWEIFWGIFNNCGRYARFLLFLMFFITLFSFFILFADFGVNFMRQGWRLRTTICAKMFYFVFISSKLCKRQMAFNVPAVYEVGGGIKRLCEAKTAAANLPE